MITLTIESEKLEKIYHEVCNDDAAAFVHYLEENTAVNNTEYEEDLSYLQPVIDEAMASPIVDKTHEEIWEELAKKV